MIKKEDASSESIQCLITRETLELGLVDSKNIHTGTNAPKGRDVGLGLGNLDRGWNAPRLQVVGECLSRRDFFAFEENAVKAFAVSVVGEMIVVYAPMFVDETFKSVNTVALEDSGLVPQSARRETRICNFNLRELICSWICGSVIAKDSAL